MKKKLAIMVVFVLAFTLLAQSVGAINVILNSSFVSFPDQKPVVENGTTLVPVRTIAERLGLEVGWDDPTDTVTLKKDNFFVELVIGSTKAKTSSGEKTLEVAPKIINGRTMVPLRFIAEELGLKVSWNEQFQRVVIAGEVDTQTVTWIPTEEATDEESTDFESEDTTETEPVEASTDEESTDFYEDEILDDFDETTLLSIEVGSSVIRFELPITFFEEDSESEESFAYKTLDATDSQHTYNWDIVTRYECYADEDGANGIAFIVQEYEPYEGESYDLSSMNQAYPEAPIKPERPPFPLDWEVFTHDLENAILTQIFTDLEVELPEGDLVELEDEELLALLGMESKEELTAQLEISQENVDYSAVPGYDEYLVWQEENQFYNEEMSIYREEYNIYLQEYHEVQAVKNYAVRKFSSIYSQASEDDWALLFDTWFNTDEEVRYDGVEILDIDGKKIIHATLYAEDPDDEQGTYEYYYFIDGDTVVTIYGGTLFGDEPSSDAQEALSNMTIR